MSSYLSGFSYLRDPSPGVAKPPLAQASSSLFLLAWSVYFGGLGAFRRTKRWAGYDDTTVRLTKSQNQVTVVEILGSLTKLTIDIIIELGPVAEAT